MKTIKVYADSHDKIVRYGEHLKSHGSFVINSRSDNCCLFVASNSYNPIWYVEHPSEYFVVLKFESPVFLGDKEVQIGQIWRKTFQCDEYLRMRDGQSSKWECTETLNPQEYIQAMRIANSGNVQVNSHLFD